MVWYDMVRLQYDEVLTAEQVLWASESKWVAAVFNLINSKSNQKSHNYIYKIIQKHPYILSKFIVIYAEVVSHERCLGESETPPAAVLKRPVLQACALPTFCT